MCLGNRLKVHINIEQGIKNLLDVFLELFFWVTIISNCSLLQCKFIVLVVIVLFEFRLEAMKTRLLPLIKKWEKYRNRSWFRLFHFYENLKLSKMKFWKVEWKMYSAKKKKIFISVWKSTSISIHLLPLHVHFIEGLLPCTWYIFFLKKLPE